MDQSCSNVLDHRCGAFRPGHDVHYIQARKAYESELRRPGVATVEPTGWIAVTYDDGSTALMWNHDATRCAALIADNNGRVELRDHCVLFVPHDGGASPICVAADITPCPETVEAPDGMTLMDQLAQRGGLVLNRQDIRRLLAEMKREPRDE
jgi:hypothetical protein